jgi:hypothetical protein
MISSSPATLGAIKPALTSFVHKVLLAPDAARPNESG